MRSPPAFCESSSGFSGSWRRSTKLGNTENIWISIWSEEIFRDPGPGQCQHMLSWAHFTVVFSHPLLVLLQYCPVNFLFDHFKRDQRSNRSNLWKSSSLQEISSRHDDIRNWILWYYKMVQLTLNAGCCWSLEDWTMTSFYSYTFNEKQKIFQQ